MRRKRWITVAVAAAGAVVLGACGDSGGGTQAATSAPSVSSTSSAAAAAGTHTDADVQFAQGMIPHHQQAIEMSDMLLAKQGVDPRIVALANDIKAAQGPEIEQLQSWLTEWGVPSAGSMPGHDMPGHNMSGQDMPGHGMMSEQDMAALQNADGAEAVGLFLTQMIEHHRGAITMAQHEIDNGEFPPAVEMARAIVSSQQQEISAMEGLLASR